MDTGAANGVRSSNTLLLEHLYDWRGLCVEPNARYFKQLLQNRRCKCLNVCLYDDQRDVHFLDGAWTLGGVLEDFSEAQLKHAMESNKLALDASGHPPSVTMRTRTLRQVLEEAGAPSVIDYWSLDVEGCELRLLRSFPFSSFTFNVITVEHNCLPVRAKIRAFLETHGFEYISTLAIDDCYVRTAAFPYRHSASYAWRRQHPVP